MIYKAVQDGEGWSVTVNGVAIFAGLTEGRAKKIKNDLQTAADRAERVSQEDGE